MVWLFGSGLLGTLILRRKKYGQSIFRRAGRRERRRPAYRRDGESRERPSESPDRHFRVLTGLVSQLDDGSSRTAASIT